VETIQKELERIEKNIRDYENWLAVATPLVQKIPDLRSDITKDARYLDDLRRYRIALKAFLAKYVPPVVKPVIRIPFIKPPIEVPWSVAIPAGLLFLMLLRPGE